MCPLTAVTKAMPEVIAQKFKSLWSCPPDAGASAGLSPELKEMLRKYSRDAYSVSSYRFYTLSKERGFLDREGKEDWQSMHLYYLIWIICHTNYSTTSKFEHQWEHTNLFILKRCCSRQVSSLQVT